MVSEPMASSLQSPLLLLSSMSNLMPVKLDSTNFIVWKHQLSSILRAYSMIDFVDGTIQSPSRFLIDAEGNFTTIVNPEFQSWDTRDQALLTLINSTLSPSVLPMVVGQNSAQSVWKTLEHRFTSTSRSNVLNLKIELHNLKKGSESVSSYLQKIKNTRDKLIAVGTLIDNEELLHIILKGLPREFGPFCSAIQTRNAPKVLILERILTLWLCLPLLHLTTETPALNPLSMSTAIRIEVEAEHNNHRGRGRFNSNNHSNAFTQGNTQFSNNQYPSSNAFTQGNAQFSQNFQGKSENSRPMCQICGKLGHQALDCYHRMDFAYQGRHPPARLAAMASTSNSSQIQAGHTPYQGHDQVAVGNGQSIPINNVGTVQSTAVPLPTPPSVPPLLSSTISGPTNTHPMHTRSKNGIFKPKIFHTSIPDYTQTEPSTYLTASKFPQWCAAMHEEYSALQRQHTWTLVPPPFGKNIVGCKWVFKLKRNSDGTISRYKARLVAKGFHQQHGIDFAETFSPVVKPPTVRTYFSSCSHLQLAIETVGSDSSLFIYSNGSTVAFLLLYVDDIVLTGNNAMFLSQLITNLSKVFELKDLGTLSFFLGLQIQRSSTGLSLTQTKYATDLLHKHNMQHCSPCNTPCVPHVRLSATEGTPLTDVHAYRSLVGALHYLTFTRPDLSFAVHQVCQFMNAPTSIHLTAAKRILRYLQGTLDHGLHYTPGPTTLSAFTDADWAGDPNDRRSTSGLLVFLGHNPITWSAKKQLTVSRSSTEAEYRALASASAEVCWLRVLLRDLGIFISAPPILWCDNVSALAIASNPVFHARTKHIEVDFHFIRERVLRKDLQVQFVSTADQLADIFTKGLLLASIS
uniref:CCHC-type domain-containing protein n=1 Tax=Fagus sylvatica TaxID=28930 RepID=A0A2N9I200_FAGSY